MVTLATPVARDLILASHVANTTGALLGSAGFGQLFRFNDISDSTNYSVIIGNQDSTNGRALHVTYGTTGAATTIATFAKAAISLDVLTAFKHADLTDPATGYTAIGARASDGRPVYYIDGGAQVLLANSTEVPSGILTTTGDMIYSSSGSTAARLAIGTTHHVLTVAGGVPSWAAGSKATLTTTGDVLYASSANTLARLAVGSTNQMLSVTAGVPAWKASTTSTLTTTGDTVYASSANTLARLAVGTTHHVLTVAGGVPSWAAGSKATLTTTGDILYASSANTLARLGIGTARQVLATNSGATAPEWVASLQSLMTAQGDIVYASAANTPARLAKGTAGLVLTMNAGATAPEWAASAAAGLVMLGAVSGTGSSGVLEVSSISAAYRSLYIELDGGRSTQTSATAAVVRMTFETSPTSGAYNNQRMLAGATATAADENIGASDFINLGIVPANDSTANAVGSLSIRLPGYAATSAFKTSLGLNCGPANLSSGNITALMSAGVWESTAAIDRVRLTLSAGNWTTTSRMTVWGLPT